MARRDGTGPDGKGPKTGRGLGDCTPTKNGTVKETVPTRGGGRGRGIGAPRRGGR